MLSEMHAQHYTRREMLVKLKEVGFDVSPGQLLSQMKKWNMMVYGERASQSAANPKSLEETSHRTASGPCIADEESVDESLQLEAKLILEDAPPLPRLSYEEADLGIRLGTRRLSVDQASEGTSGGISFSSLGNAEDPLVQESHTAHRDKATLYYLPSPPPSDPLESATDAPQSDLADAGAILRQVSTITEPWCGNFPTICCCQAFFRGHSDFGRSSELYKIILEQSPPQSLKYIVALLNLVETEPNNGDRQELRNHFWDTINYYLQICTRTDLKNKLAPHILHRLLKVWEAFTDGDRLPLPTADLFRSTAAETHESLINKILKTKLAVNANSNPSDQRVNWHIESERDVGCVVGFVVCKPSTFPLLNCAGEVFGSTDSWKNLTSTTQVQRSLTELVPAANRIAAYMRSQWNKGISIASAYDLGDCDLQMIFAALGLMIALETTSFASDFTDPESWRPGLQAFIETTVNTLSLNADYADKFRKAYWLVRCETIGHSGKTVHMGEPCIATHEWEILDRSIHDYDEERTWFERRLFSGRHNSWPQVNDLMAGTDDNMSIRSESSFNSFRKFQALALHLKIGTPASRSLKTKGSSSKSRRSSESHMSWRLEQVLQIHDEDDVVESEEDGHEPEVSDSAQRAHLDQVAFEKMPNYSESC